MQHETQSDEGEGGILRARTLTESLNSVTASSSANYKKSTVRFNHVDVREYAVTIGDNPSCSIGPPVRWVIISGIVSLLKRISSLLVSKIQMNTFTNTTILLLKLIIVLTGITLMLIKKFLLMSSRGVGTRSAEILMTLGCQTEFANTYWWKLGIIPWLPSKKQLKIQTFVETKGWKQQINFLESFATKGY